MQYSLPMDMKLDPLATERAFFSALLSANLDSLDSLLTEDFLLIVTSQTYQRWGLKPRSPTLRTRKGTVGRPLTAQAIERLIIRMATENRLNRWSSSYARSGLNRFAIAATPIAPALRRLGR